jgi:hypothetical protein
MMAQDHITARSGGSPPLSIEYGAVSDLKPYAQNGRRHSMRQIKQIAEGIHVVTGKRFEDVATDRLEAAHG